MYKNILTPVLIDHEEGNQASYAVAWSYGRKLVTA